MTHTQTTNFVNDARSINHTGAGYAIKIVNNHLIMTCCRAKMTWLPKQKEMDGQMVVQREGEREKKPSEGDGIQKNILLQALELQPRKTNSVKLCFVNAKLFVWFERQNNVAYKPKRVNIIRGQCEKCVDIFHRKNIYRTKHESYKTWAEHVFKSRRLKTVPSHSVITCSKRQAKPNQTQPEQSHAFESSSSVVKHKCFILLCCLFFFFSFIRCYTSY